MGPYSPGAVSIYQFQRCFLIKYLLNTQIMMWYHICDSFNLRLFHLLDEIIKDYINYCWHFSQCIFILFKHSEDQDSGSEYYPPGAGQADTFVASSPAHKHCTYNVYIYFFTAEDASWPDFTFCKQIVMVKIIFACLHKPLKL